MDDSPKRTKFYPTVRYPYALDLRSDDSILKLIPAVSAIASAILIVLAIPC